MTLRSVLSFIFIILSFFTVGGMAWISCAYSYHSLKRVTTEKFAVQNEAAGREIVSLLDTPAREFLSELPHRAEINSNYVLDRYTLMLDVGERLKVHPHLAWLSYSAANGDFIGALRRPEDPGTIIVNRSTLKDAPEDFILTNVGTLTPPYRTGLPDHFNPLEHDWYKKASASHEIQWSQPYHFTNGMLGITASRGWFAPGAKEASGVFTVDFYLNELQTFLANLANDQGEFVAVLTGNGDLICSSRVDDHLSAILTQAVTSPSGRSSDLTRLMTVDDPAGNQLVAMDRLSAPFPLVVATCAPASLIYAEADHAVKVLAVVGGVGLLLALALGWFVARRISEPLRLLSNELKRVGEFQLDSAVGKASFLHEVNVVNDASEVMKTGLRSFIRYVPRDLVRQLLSSGKEAKLGGETREVTIFLSDIQEFTTYSEHVPPEKLIWQLATYFEILAESVQKNSGTLDKFIGDGLLAFFNAPLDVAKHQQAACFAALRVQETLLHNKSPFRTRIGLHAGPVLVGNIGTPERFAYTVLGDVVNATSRVEALNKLYGTYILASQTVQSNTDGELEWRFLDRVVVVGRSTPLGIYELMGTTKTVSEREMRSRDLYEKALLNYFRRDFVIAKGQFLEAGNTRGHDPASQLMAQRCEKLDKNKPGSDWNGAFVQTTK